MSRQNLTPVNFPVLASDPVTPTPREGDIYLNASLGLRYYESSSWHTISAGAAASTYPPLIIASGDVFQVPDNTQVLVASLSIDGEVEFDGTGELVEVA